MDIIFSIQIHLFCVVLSIILGFLNLIFEKGTRSHKSIGKLWFILMLVTSLSSFFIMPTGSLTWLHLFSIVVIISVSIGVVAIRNQNQRLHIRCMIGAYIGTVVSAFFAISVQGRLLHGFLQKML